MIPAHSARTMLVDMSPPAGATTPILKIPPPDLLNGFSFVVSCMLNPFSFGYKHGKTLTPRKPGARNENKRTEGGR